MPSPPDAAADRTIDELAHQAGVPVSTVRMYQQRGLLSPPEKRGRVGYYSEAHLARLRLIAEMQGRGWSLAAIQDLLAGWEGGHSLPDLIGMRAGTGLWTEPEAVVVDVAELADQFPPGALSPEAIRRAAELGLVEVTDDGLLRVPEMAAAVLGARLAHLGIPAEDYLDEWEHLTAVTDEVAARFADLFRRHLWARFEAAGLPPDQVDQLRAELEELGPLALQALELAFQRSLRRQARTFLDQAAGALGVPPAG